MNIRNLKLHGGGYITVIDITAVHKNTAHQKLDLISCSLSQILLMLDSFFPLKTCYLSKKISIFFTLLLHCSTFHALFGL
jgi:hypothetical protein